MKKEIFVLLALCGFILASSDFSGYLAGTTENVSAYYIDNTTGLPITGATCNVSIYNSSFKLNVTATAGHLGGGLYSYAYAVPSTTGIYWVNFNCTGTAAQFPLWVWAPFYVVSQLETNKTAVITGINSSLMTTGNYNNLLSGMGANTSAILADNLAGNNSIHGALGNGTLARKVDVTGINSTLLNTSFYQQVAAQNASAFLADNLAGNNSVHQALANNMTFFASYLAAMNGTLLAALAQNGSNYLGNLTSINNSVKSVNATVLAVYAGILAGQGANTTAILAAISGITPSDLSGIYAALSAMNVTLQANITSVNDTVKAINASQWDHFANKTDVNVSVFPVFNVTVNATGLNVTINSTALAGDVWSFNDRTLTSIDFSPITSLFDDWGERIMRLLREIRSKIPW